MKSGKDNEISGVTVSGHNEKQTWMGMDVDVAVDVGVDDCGMTVLAITITTTSNDIYSYLNTTLAGFNYARIKH